MKKNKNFSMENKYTFVDAFRCFFILLIAMTVMSFVMQIVLSIVATTTGQDYDFASCNGGNGKGQSFS